MEGSGKERASLLFAAREALHALPDFVLAVSREFRCQFANRGARALMDRPWSAIRGRRLQEVLPLELGIALEDVADTAYRTRRPFVEHIAGPRSTVFEVRAQSLAEDSVLLLVRDVTRVRDAEMNTAQLTEHLTGVLGIAHDLNNLLTVIRANLDLAVAALPRDATIETELADALGAVRRASELIRQFLAFGRKHVVQLRAVDVNALATDMRALLRHVLGSDIKLQLTLIPSVWPVFGDPTQLEQVLMNLAVNARDAMPKGGRLLISTANVAIHEPLRERPGLRPGEYVLIIVEDTGHGIDPSLMGRIFEPFFTTKEPGRGTGLGLATVYGIVKQTGGCAYAETSPSGGARFLVFLPRYKDRVGR